MTKLEIPDKKKNKEDKKKKKDKKDKKGKSDQFEKSFKKPKEEKVKRKIDPASLIPSGSTTFNLECSDHIEGAFQLGKFTNMIGDSSSGKSLFCWTSLAECSHDVRFDNYDLIMADCEQAGEFDIPFLFGKKTAARVKNLEDDAPDTVEQFIDQIGDLIEKGKPFIYILDSLDSVTSEAEMLLEATNRKKRKKQQKAEGSYNLEKQKAMSKFFRTTKKALRKMKSAIIIISQTRDNIGFGGFLNPKSRSGGKALKFYSTHEVWGSVGKKKKKNGRTILTETAWKITKNKVTGRHGIAYFNIVQDYGIDDIGSCVDFLIEEGEWKSSSETSINTKGFAGFEKNASRKELLSKIGKDKSLYQKLKQLCQETYDKVLAGLDHGREMRYE